MKNKKLGVHLKVSDIEQSLKFYTAFSFKPIFAYGGSMFLSNFNNISTASEKYNGVVFGVGDALLEIADGHIAVKPEVFKESIRSSKISLMIDVDSVKEIEETCSRNKIKISVPIKQFPWNTKEIVIKDPDGTVLVFRELLS